jgi:diguanylate cyclase (GGDEF)-like protein
MRSRRRLVSQVAPFAAGALLGFVLVPIGNSVNWTEYAAAAAMTVLIVIASLREDWPLAAPLTFVFALALLRDAGGGQGSGAGTLVLLPVFWLALHGTRKQLMVLVAAVWAFYFVPIVVIGGAGYPSSGWRSSVVVAAVAAIIGLATQRLVGNQRNRTQELDARKRDLEAITALSRTLLGSGDARQRICDGAAGVCGAYFALLLEVRGDSFVTTAAAGLPVPELRRPLDDPSWLGTALRSRTAQFGDPGQRDDANHDMYEAAQRPAAVLIEPVLRDDEAIGLMVLGWRETPADQARAIALVRMLGAEAAVAIERADLLGHLTAIAATDELTGLPNRRAWDEQLAAALAADDPFCVAVIDLDHFKVYNDKHGHLAGDRLLVEAASAWGEQLRPTDILARYGGEEFVVMLRGCGIDDAFPAVERLRGATPMGESCSAGIVTRRPGETAAELIGRADDALYEAKRGGRDQLLAA